mmetsp:Transcript_85059/g.244117  ORF Transcript_85059/g.244117 Transcript_85059/m.244117 type:complete len:238 (+) Transcript_85059:331-1044(+)
MPRVRSVHPTPPPLSFVRQEGCPPVLLEQVAAPLKFPDPPLLRRECLLETIVDGSLPQHRQQNVATFGLLCHHARLDRTLQPPDALEEDQTRGFRDAAAAPILSPRHHHPFLYDEIASKRDVMRDAGCVHRDHSWFSSLNSDATARSYLRFPWAHRSRGHWHDKGDLTYVHRGDTVTVVDATRHSGLRGTELAQEFYVKVAVRPLLFEELFLDCMRWQARDVDLHEYVERLLLGGDA